MYRYMDPVTVFSDCTNTEPVVQNSSKGNYRPRSLVQTNTNLLSRTINRSIKFGLLIWLYAKSCRRSVTWPAILIKWLMLIFGMRGFVDLGAFEVSQAGEPVRWTGRPITLYTLRRRLKLSLSQKFWLALLSSGTTRLTTIWLRYSRLLWL